MEFRFLLVGFLLAMIFCAIAIFVLPPQAQEDEFERKEQSQWYELAYVKNGQYGGKDAVALQIRAPAENNASVAQLLFYDTRPQKEVVVLGGDWIGLQNMEKLGTALRKRTGELGMGFSVKNSGDAAPSMQPRIVLLPSGVWPQGFDYRQKLTDEDCFVFLGLRKNISLLEGGGVVEGGVPQSFLESEEFVEHARYKFWKSGKNAYAIHMTLDDIENYDEFSETFLSFATYYCSEENIVLESEFEYAQDEAYVQEIERAEFVRIFIIDSQGFVLRMWDEHLDELQGSLDGDSQSPAQGTRTFRAYVRQNVSMAKNMKFYAVVYDTQYRLHSKTLIRESAGETQPFMKSFLVDNWPASDFGIVEIQDQFARVYARGFVSLPEYRVVEQESVGAQKRFLILKNSKPVSDMQVRVRLADSQNWAFAPVRGGKTSVASEWKEGENSIEFEIEGNLVPHTWIGNGDGTLMRFLRLLVWVLPLFVLIYFFVSLKRHEAYSIVVEETAPHEAQEILVSSTQLAEIVREPMSIEEIAEVVQKKIIPKRKTLGITSLQSSLDGLFARKLLVKYLDYYAPGKTSKERLRAICLVKRIKDGLLENGIGIKRLNGEEIRDTRNRVWKIYDQKYANRVEGGRVGKIPDFLLFESKKAIEKFEVGSLLSGSRDANRLKLARKLGKIKFVLIEEISKAAKYD